MKPARHSLRRWLRPTLVVALVIVAIWVWYSGAVDALTLENLKLRQRELAYWAAANPWAFAVSYFLAYVAVAALSIPGAAVMTLAGGALFGLTRATLLVSFASTI